MEDLERKEKEILEKETKEFFAQIIEGVKNGSLVPILQAKCICVDARKARADEVGTEFTTYSQGKVEKVFTVKEDTVFVTTLDRNGEPVIDKKGNKNIYDMSETKFNKKYKLHKNGHYVQDPTPMVTIKLPDSMIPEQGKKLLPPCWGGYDGTLMRGGLIMLPYNPKLSKSEQIKVWETYLTKGESVDWYPNNEAGTYAVCDKNGVFEDPELRGLYGQGNSDECLV